MSIIGNSNIGFFTTVIGVVATVIGAGVVIGGFAGAGLGVVGGRSRKEVEADALWHGFWGGVIAVVCLILDLSVGYAES